MADNIQEGSEGFKRSFDEHIENSTAPTLTAQEQQDRYSGEAPYNRAKASESASGSKYAGTLGETGKLVEKHIQGRDLVDKMISAQDGETYIAARDELMKLNPDMTFDEINDIVSRRQSFLSTQSPSVEPQVET